ncbi:permease [Myxococcota bacterium]|nr:permease [Myxococcota bacterium]
MSELKKLFLLITVFLGIWFLPLDSGRFVGAIYESLALAKWYAREHVILCLIPAFLIAGAISVFVSSAAVMKYLGAGAKKLVAYPIAAVSGTILAVCSCTVLPLFASIYKRGAGLGPATAFLYSGPAINVLAIVLTARVLGPKLGLARAIGAVVFAVVIGVLMELIFRREEQARQTTVLPSDGETPRKLWQDVVFVSSMIGFLVFANWGRPAADETGIWVAIFKAKWILSGAFAALTVLSLLLWFRKDEVKDWGDSSWTFALQILPLLLGGVLVAGFLLGGPGGTDHGVIPNHWIESAVGGNSILANLFASVAGAFMYFATLTEVPILKGLMDSGMGEGPALALLLAGPALSLPSMLVIRSVMGTKKTVVYVALVIVLSTSAGFTYGLIA